LTHNAQLRVNLTCKHITKEARIMLHTYPHIHTCDEISQLMPFANITASETKQKCSN